MHKYFINYVAPIELIWNIIYFHGYFGRFKNQFDVVSDVNGRARSELSEAAKTVA